MLRKEHESETSHPAFEEILTNWSGNWPTNRPTILTNRGAWGYTSKYCQASYSMLHLVTFKMVINVFLDGYTSPFPSLNHSLKLPSRWCQVIGIHSIHRRTEWVGGDGPLLGHFVKDFTKTVDFSQSSPPPLLSFSVRPCTHSIIHPSVWTY